MNTQALIDGIVQQTTVLIAHLATAGGIRAPLARIANRVFLELGEELSRQGVQKNVIADMFGMALRTYHRRVRSVAESETEAGHTVWDAVLDFIRDKQPVTASQIKDRFRHDEPSVVTGALSDLCGSGFVYRSGRGDGAVFRIAEAQDFEHANEAGRREANEYVVWLAVYRHGPLARAALLEATRLTDEQLEAALATLAADGRIEASRAPDGSSLYKSARFDVPVGASQGWEAAVLDHFRAVANAIANKVRQGRARSDFSDVIGGGTLSFDLEPGHPFEQRVTGLLDRVRKDVNALWSEVSTFNRSHTFDDERRFRVWFYFGQNVERPEDGDGRVQEGS